jgi:hypothetical protein
MRTRWALAAVVAFGLLSIPAVNAGKPKDGPNKNQISKADARVKFDKNDTVVDRHSSGKTVKFTPADIGHLNTEELANGAIIGKLETERNTKDGLTPGSYRVYVRKQGKWQVFFCHEGQTVAQADDVTGNLDGEKKPKFVDGGSALRYGWWKFSY